MSSVVFLLAALALYSPRTDHALLAGSAMSAGENNAAASSSLFFVDGCANGCSGRGACYHGLCICEPGWTGADCGARRFVIDTTTHYQTH